MSSRASRLGRAAAIVLTCLAVLTACGNTVSKIGAPVTSAKVIHLGAADVTNPQLLDFIAGVASRSHHTMRIELDRTTYSSETPGAEEGLPGAVAAGKVELGFSPSRDWEQAGAPGFGALMAPGLITTTAAEIAVAKGPVARTLLRDLGTKRVVGLAITPDEPRRLFTHDPVAALQDLRGKRIRISDNTGTAAMMQALGAIPVQGIDTGAAKDELLAGDLDGIETGPTSASHYSLDEPTPYVSSFALIPKFEVLTAAPRFWHDLSAAQRGIVRAAARAATASAVTAVPAAQAAHLGMLCKRGAVVVQPSAAAIDTILAAARTSTATDTADRALLPAISTAIGRAGSDADASTVPTGCPIAATTASAVRLHDAATHSTSTSVDPKTVPKQLVGTYRIVVTKADWAKGGVVGPEVQVDIVFTWRLYADGRMYETQDPDYPDQGPEGGTWRVKGKHLHLVYGSPGGTEHDFDETVTWSFLRGALNLEPVSVQDQQSLVIYSVPWQKIG